LDGPGCFSFAAQGAAGKRLVRQVQGIRGMGRMGSGNVRAPGKSAFDQRSRLFVFPSQIHFPVGRTPSCHPTVFKPSSNIPHV
jgi:hypothetical protein